MRLVDEILTLNQYELAIFDHSYNSVVITTPFLEGDHPKILYVNSAFSQMSGYTKEEIIGKTPRVLQGEKTDKATLERLKESLVREEFFEGKAINYTKEGKEYWVEWNISPIYDEDKNLIAFLSLQKDVSIAHKLLNHIKLFQKAVDQNHNAIAIFNEKGEYVYINQSYSLRTGYEMKDLVEKTPNILKSGVHDEGFYRDLWSKLLSKKPFETIFCNKNANGTLYYEKQTITPILDDENLIGFITIGKNYDEEQRQNEQLKNDTLIDSLTKLFNKKAFDEKFKNAIKNFTQSGNRFSMAFIDLDNFKQVNDTMGHDKGDSALVECANFLRENTRKSDEIFRFGGDEFIILLYETKQKDALALCQKLETLFLKSDIALRYPIGISLGCKEYEGEDADLFFKQTDSEMYESKKRKKGK